MAPQYKSTVPSRAVSYKNINAAAQVCVLSWSFRSTVNAISVCRSIFWYATLQSAPRPFDPPPDPPEAAGYRSDNGPEWFSWPPLRQGLLAPKHVQWRWVNSQVLAFPLLFLALFFFVLEQKWMAFEFLFPVEWIVSLRNLCSDNIKEQAESGKREFMCLGYCVSLNYE